MTQFLVPISPYVWKHWETRLCKHLVDIDILISTCVCVYKDKLSIIPKTTDYKSSLTIAKNMKSKQPYDEHSTGIL